MERQKNGPPFLFFLRFIPPFPNFEALGSPHLYKLLLQLLEREIFCCCLKIASFSLARAFPVCQMEIVNSQGKENGGTHKAPPLVANSAYAIYSPAAPETEGHNPSPRKYPSTSVPAPTSQIWELCQNVTRSTSSSCGSQSNRQQSPDPQHYHTLWSQHQIHLLSKF